MQGLGDGKVGRSMLSIPHSWFVLYFYNILLGISFDDFLGRRHMQTISQQVVSSMREPSAVVAAFLTPSSTPESPQFAAAANVILQTEHQQSLYTPGRTLLGYLRPLAILSRCLCSAISGPHSFSSRSYFLSSVRPRAGLCSTGRCITGLAGVVWPSYALERREKHIL